MVILIQFSTQKPMSCDVSWISWSGSDFCDPLTGPGVCRGSQTSPAMPDCGGALWIVEICWKIWQDLARSGDLFYHVLSSSQKKRPKRSGHCGKDGGREGASALPSVLHAGAPFVVNFYPSQLVSKNSPEPRPRFFPSHGGRRGYPQFSSIF